MSQNNGGLNWDQLQMPSFSGSMGGLATSANMLDKALGRLRGMNDQVGEMRSDEQEKLLLQNIMGAASGQAALDGLGDGSLLANLDMKRLSNEALRNVYKDIGNRLNTEGLGIKNTQGLLDHDLTKANTANANARTQSTLASIAEATANQNREASNREYSNIVANRVMNMNPAERSAWLQSDEHRGLMNQYGQGMSAFDSALASIDKSAATSSNVLDFESRQRTEDDRVLNETVNSDLSNLVSSFNTKEEQNAAVNDYISAIKGDAVLQGKVAKIAVDKGYSVDTRSVQSDFMNNLSTDAQSAVLGTIDSYSNNPTNLTPADLMNPPSQADLDKQFEDNTLAGSLPENVDYLSDGYGDVLNKAMDISIDRDNPVNNKDGSFDIVDADTIKQYSNDKRTFSQAEHIGSMKPLRRNESTPYTASDYNIVAKADPELVNQPMTASNIAKFNKILRESKYKDTRKDRAIKYKREVETKEKEFYSTNLSEARSLGLQGDSMYSYASNKSKTQAINFVNGANSAKNLTMDSSEQSLMESGNFYDRLSKSPTATIKAVRAEDKKLIEVASTGNEGALYLDTSSLDSVPNNITDVGSSISSTLGHKSPSKTIDILAEMKNDFPSANPKLLGAVLKSMGGEYDKKEATKLINNYSSANQEIYNTVLNNYKSLNEEYYTALESITTELGKLDLSRNIPAAEKEKIRENLTTQQRAITDTILQNRNNLKIDVERLFKADK